MSGQQEAVKIVSSLTTSNLFSHFLLLHDFFYKITKIPASSSEFFDLQVDIQLSMNNGTNMGGRIGQLSIFLGLVAYCLKSKKIGRKFIYGFLYVYWTNHFYTLGTYAGALVKIPGNYKKIVNYYNKSQRSEPNYLQLLHSQISKKENYEESHQILKNVFPEVKASGKSLLQNDFFAKNREKYIREEDMEKKSLKLPYLDSFLTRYVYHSFRRWFERVGLFVGVKQQ